MNNWKKLIACLLAAVMMLSCVSAFAETAEAAETTETTEATETTEETVTATEATEEALADEEEAAPVLLATVNGKEIYDTDEEVASVVSSYSYYISYDPSLETYIMAMALTDAIDSAVINEKIEAAQTEEKQAELEAEAQKIWDSEVEWIATQLAGLTDESTEEEINAAKEDALSYISYYYGYDAESYKAAYIRGELVSEMLTEYNGGDFTVSEEEVIDYFNELVEEAKQQALLDPDTYANYVEYGQDANGNAIVYIPEGFRGVNHILLDVDDELLNNYTTLLAQLEEQDEEVTADEETTDEAAAEETAETTEEPAEPVTQEMVDAARQAILDSVQGTVDEIMQKLADGADFNDLIVEYGQDPGMTDETMRQEGYTVHNGSTLYVEEFTDAAMGLKEIGDVSDPVLMGSYGVTLIHYQRDLPAGAVELTQELHDSLAEELIAEKQSLAYNDMIDSWVAAAEIVYTEEGQAIMDAAAALEKENSEEATN